MRTAHCDAPWGPRPPEDELRTEAPVLCRRPGVLHHQSALRPQQVDGEQVGAVGQASFAMCLHLNPCPNGRNPTIRADGDLVRGEGGEHPVKPIAVHMYRGRQDGHHIWSGTTRGVGLLPGGRRANDGARWKLHLTGGCLLA